MTLSLPYILARGNGAIGYPVLGSQSCENLAERVPSRFHHACENGGLAAGRSRCLWFFTFWPNVMLSWQVIPESCRCGMECKRILAECAFNLTLVFLHKEMFPNLGATLEFYPITFRVLIFCHFDRRRRESRRSGSLVREWRRGGALRPKLSLTTHFHFVHTFV